MNPHNNRTRETNGTIDLSILENGTIQGACMHDCPDTCAWLVTVEKNQAVRLEGNPEHPMTRGKLCGKVNHYLERVYHPDRILHPLKQVGTKKEPSFVRVSWAEAIEEVAARWKSIIAKYGAEAILPFSSAGTQGMIQMASLDRRLFGVLGCSQLERNICGAVASTGLSDTNGQPYGVDPEELVHSRFIVLWGRIPSLPTCTCGPFFWKPGDEGPSW